MTMRSCRVDAAAEEAIARILVARIKRRETLFERARVGLENPRRLDRVGAVHQPVAPLRLQQQALL